MASHEDPRPRWGFIANSLIVAEGGAGSIGVYGKYRIGLINSTLIGAANTIAALHGNCAGLGAPASGDAVWSRPADHSGSPGAAKIRRAAGAPGAGCVPRRAAPAPDR